MTNKAFDTAANAASSREHTSHHALASSSSPLVAPSASVTYGASPTSPVNTAAEHSYSYTWCFW